MENRVRRPRGDERVSSMLPESGAPDAATMFLMHYLDLVRLARLLLDDRETAEEIVQDVFAAMQSRWRKFPDDGAALRYLRTAVVNRSRSALRRRITHRKHDAERPMPPPAPAAEDTALARWERARIRDAVAVLPHRQREVIALRYFQNLSVAETAAVLKVSPGAVTSSASRALGAIEKSIARLS